MWAPRLWPTYGSTPIQIHFASMQGGSMWTTRSTPPSLCHCALLCSYDLLSSAYPTGPLVFPVRCEDIHYLIALPDPRSGHLDLRSPSGPSPFCLPASPTTTRFSGSPSSRDRAADTRRERETDRKGREKNKAIVLSFPIEGTRSLR